MYIAFSCIHTITKSVSHLISFFEDFAEFVTSSNQCHVIPDQVSVILKIKFYDKNNIYDKIKSRFDNERLVSDFRLSR